MHVEHCSALSRPPTSLRSKDAGSINRIGDVLDPPGLHEGDSVGCARGRLHVHRLRVPVRKRTAGGRGTPRVVPDPPARKRIHLHEAVEHESPPCARPEIALVPAETATNIIRRPVHRPLANSNGQAEPEADVAGHGVTGGPGTDEDNFREQLPGKRPGRPAQLLQNTAHDEPDRGAPVFPEREDDSVLPLYRTPRDRLLSSDGNLRQHTTPQLD